MIHKEKEKRSRQVTQLSTSRIPGGFTEKTARVNGVTLNYATGGTGPAVVLLHGYPQTWYMWRKVMAALAEQYTVIAPDLRGSGGSDAPTTPMPQVLEWTLSASAVRSWAARSEWWRGGRRGVET
jgi:pimeloyl-ACP methyl ester carboxylesterase